MAYILIPSKNIYNIDDYKVIDNKIASIERQTNKVIHNLGNVLNKEYNFRFAESLYTNSEGQLVSNPEYTEGFSFDIVYSEELSGYRAVGIIEIVVDKKTIIKLGEENGNTVITSHKLNNSQEWEFKGSNSLTNRLQINVPRIISYDEQSGVISLEYSVFIGDNDFSKLISDKVTLVGNYKSVEQILEKVGEGTPILKLDTNEFLQSTNYNDYLLAQILRQYKNGKEIATIKCDINTYYDENGVIVISPDIDNKMIFEHYNVVLPLIPNSWGTESPMSYNQNGKAKLFEIVGINYIFDGACWQELSIIEQGEADYMIQLPAPILTLLGNTITIYDKSERAQSFDIYLNGTLNTTITGENTFDISTLDLSKGNYKIYVIAKAEGYKDSARSNSISFSTIYTTYYTEINFANGLTYFISSNDYTVANGTYIIGD